MAKVRYSLVLMLIAPQNSCQSSWSSAMASAVLPATGGGAFFTAAGRAAAGFVPTAFGAGFAAAALGSGVTSFGAGRGATPAATGASPGRKKARSEERRVGNKGVSPCRPRGPPDPNQNKHTT